MEQIEITLLDTRHESLRLKDKVREKILLDSIVRQGIREPLQCVIKEEGKYILLDGFKRLRCCRRIKLSIVPVVYLGNNEAEGIMQLIRVSNEKNLNILEQAALIDRLNREHNLSVTEIADYVERSKAWVSVRLGIIQEMSELVRDKIFSGKFPVRSYMYTLRQFTRVNKIGKSGIENFVRSVSGRGLSGRNIDILAYGYFRGGKLIKEQIEAGNLEWTISRMGKIRELNFEGKEEINEQEAVMLKDLELVQKYMNRVIYGIKDKELSSDIFFNTADLLIVQILENLKKFKESIEEFSSDKRKQT